MALSGAAALKSTESALLGPVLGWLVDRYGSQRVVRAGVILFGSGFMLLSQTNTLPMFYGAFVVLAAWAFSEGGRRIDMPANFLAILLLPLTIVPLILQPDFGQTMLLSMVWAALFFMAGLHWFWVAGLGGAGLLGVAAGHLAPSRRVRYWSGVRSTIRPNPATRCAPVVSRSIAT